MGCLTKVGRVVSLIMDAIYANDNDDDLVQAIYLIIKDNCNG